jgi:formylglycine-generating enzyme required for sulfatase activity
MLRFLWVALVVTSVCSCDTAETKQPGKAERPDKGRSGLLTLRAAALAKEGGGRKSTETRDQELGEFIYMPGGEFTMGCNNGEHADERPEHVVRLSPFYVGETPVTNLQFVRFLNESQLEPNEYLY